MGYCLAPPFIFCANRHGIAITQFQKQVEKMTENGSVGKAIVFLWHLVVWQLKYFHDLYLESASLFYAIVFDYTFGSR